MSWSDCMEKKIDHEWGPTAAKECAHSFSKGNLEGMAECIIKYAEVSDPEVVLGRLTEWSLGCAI